MDGKGRLNVISYELCVLTQLRTCLRAKEIWITGADRYRNPDDDLPKDFAERWGAYYEDLKLSQDAAGFVAGIKAQLEGELRLLNTSIIDWAEIERQYDEIVKYAAAMQHGTADPEAILRRFAHAEVMHPTYKALAELGRAIKMIFLCRYLRSEAYRREINEGLNVVENWNGANGFVFFGKGGEISTNRIVDQEVLAHALHLLQSSLVYVNTRMVQSILSNTEWAARLLPEDYRGLSPLIYAHINPYGRFDVDLDKRIDFERMAA